MFPSETLWDTNKCATPSAGIILVWAHWTAVQQDLHSHVRYTIAVQTQNFAQLNPKVDSTSFGRDADAAKGQ